MQPWNSHALKVAVAASLALGTLAAQAQQASAPANALEEVVVTAQKREEKLQDVSISISAFSGDAMKDMNWNNIAQVASQTPNLDIKYVWGNSMPVATIRGIGMNDFQANSKPGVGFYVDEVYLPSIALMGLQLFDMERLEVLKGPQGDLYGRNTNGGAINYITRKPSDDASGYARASYGNFDRFEVEGAAGGPISKTVAGRFSAYAVQQDKGWVLNRTTGYEHGKVDIYALRGQLLFKPSDSLDVLANVHYGRDQSEGAYFQHVGFWNKGATAATPAAQRYCPSVLQGVRNPATCFDSIGYSDTDGDVYAGEYTVRNDLSQYGNPLNFDRWTLDNKNLGGFLRFDWGMSSGMQFTSLTSFENYDRFQPKESDAEPGLTSDLWFASKIRAWSQEFRLASSAEGPVTWIAGLHYTNESVDEDPPRVLFTDTALRNRVEVLYEQDQHQAAVFGHVEWKFADAWKLSLGGRYLDEHLEFKGRSSFLLAPDFTSRLVLAQIPGTLTAGSTTIDVPGIIDEKATTWRVALDWKPADNVLLYASAADGYKGGGYNGGFVASLALWVPYRPEDVKAFELGFKSDWFARRLIFNGAVFYNDYTDLQAVSSRSNLLGVPGNFLANVSEAKIKGAEFELSALLTPDLQVRAGLGLLDAKNKDPQPLFDGPYAAAGVYAPRKLANSPDYTANIAVTWDVPLSNGYKLRFATDANRTGKQFKEIQNNIAMEVPAQGLWNGSISLRSDDDTWNVSLWGRNLADEEYIMDTLSTAAANGWGVIVYGMPRTYGVSAEFRW